MCGRTSSHRTSLFGFIVLLLVWGAGQAGYSQNLPPSDRTSQWNGYEQVHFRVANRDAYLVQPKMVATGKPWVWRARFPNFHTQVDLALLKQGYHIAYVDVADLFGSPAAMEIGDAFYRLLTEGHEFSTRPVMEGVSRGGLFVYNWAVRNPQRVSCIYCDTPVCDIKSWPAGKGSGLGSPPTWARCLDAYQMTEEQALKFNGNPIDHAQVIAEAGIPLMHLVSENDQVVPPLENTYVLRDRLASFGFPMQVISVAEGSKKSNGHHMEPPDPQRVVDFVLKHDRLVPQRREMIREAQRVMFLGDSITYGGYYVGSFETWLQMQPWSSSPQIINVGLPSETVSGLSERGHAGGKFPRPDLAERLERVLDSARPDLVFACYGINCGIYQPFDEKRFQAYQDGILNLKRKVEATGARIVFLTPPTFDDQRANREFSYDSVMDRYSKWLVSKRQDGWEVIDLHSAMAEELLHRRQTDPEFTFQPDAVHPQQAGHWYIATRLFDWLGDPRAAHTRLPDDYLNYAGVPDELIQRNLGRMNVLRDAYLSAAGHLRPGIRKGLPLMEAKKTAAEAQQAIDKILNSAKQE